MSIGASSVATLGSTPLLHLLISVAERQLSGSLVFESPDGFSGAIHFDFGTPRKVLADGPRTRLGELLVDFGWLDPHSAQETYAMAKAQNELHGHVLLDCRLVDRAGLTHMLWHQLVRKLQWLATRPPETRIGMREGEDVLYTLPPGPDDISPLAVLWALARSHVDTRSLRPVLERVAHRPLSLHRMSDPKQFGFNEEEMALVELLRSGQLDGETLLRRAQLPRQTAEAMLYLLLLTHHLDVGDGRHPLCVANRKTLSDPHTSGEYAAVERPRVEPGTSGYPGQDLGSTLALRRELRAHAERAEFTDPYVVLGVPRGASIPTIRNAFTLLARRFHPERLPSELYDLRPMAAQLLTRLMAAYRALATDGASVPPGVSDAGHEKQVNRSLCYDALRRAEQFLHRDRLQLAEAEAKRALTLDPTNPRCIALHAWIRSLQPHNANDLGSIERCLTEALDLDPMSVKARYYRSEILKRLNRLEEAVGEWRLILELDPKHLEAQRELRLWEMRRGGSKPPKQSTSGLHRQGSLVPPATGLFGKLFKGSR